MSPEPRTTRTAEITEPLASVETAGSAPTGGSVTARPTDAGTTAEGALPLTFVAPPFGLDPLVEFVLDPLGAGLHALRGPGEVRLFVLDAAVHLPDYSPELTDEQAATLGLEDAADALLLVVATPGDTGTTVNLLAPIVVHRGTGRAAQLILEGQDHPLRAELTAG